MMQTGMEQVLLNSPMMVLVCDGFEDWKCCVKGFLGILSMYSRA